MHGSPPKTRRCDSSTTRSPTVATPEQILMAEAMTADPAISTRQVAEQFGIHRSTLYRHLNARQKGSA